MVILLVGTDTMLDDMSVGRDEEVERGADRPRLAVLTTERGSRHDCHTAVRGDNEAARWMAFQVQQQFDFVAGEGHRSGSEVLVALHVLRDSGTSEVGHWLL
jgi:hypothetical protein